MPKTRDAAAGTAALVQLAPLRMDWYVYLLRRENGRSIKKARARVGPMRRVVGQPDVSLRFFFLGTGCVGITARSQRLALALGARDTYTAATRAKQLKQKRRSLRCWS